MRSQGPRLHASILKCTGAPALTKGAFSGIPELAPTPLILLLWLLGKCSNLNQLNSQPGSTRIRALWGWMAAGTSFVQTSLPLEKTLSLGLGWAL